MNLPTPANVSDQEPTTGAPPGLSWFEEHARRLEMLERSGEWPEHDTDATERPHPDKIAIDAFIQSLNIGS